jgi:hypothetical protein
MAGVCATAQFGSMVLGAQYVTKRIYQQCGKQAITLSENEKGERGRSTLPHFA